VVRSHDLDDVVAVVHLRDLPGKHVTVAEAARQALQLPDSLPVSDALRRFKAEREQFAVVVDERGGVERMQTDPRWRNNLLFFEYFHGDNGAGLGASHQTGWTGLVADVIRRRHRAYPTVSEVVQRLVSRTET